MATLSRLLALPRELRNIIYEFTVISEEQTLRIKQQPLSPGHSKFISSSPLLSVCKQLSAEYVEAFTKHFLSPGHEEMQVVVAVADLDFAGLQALIQSLESGQVDHLRAKCRLLVSLVFTHQAPGLVGNEVVTDIRLGSWARLCDTEGLHATYVLDETAVRWDWYAGDVFEPYGPSPELPEEKAIRDAVCHWTSNYEWRLVRESIAAKRAA
ncbi:hypothetical protein LTR10_000283 [Elasticomyces elasticus]|nr:hypothetical protein LTR10_000283 [Elasticomyces elasticus]KAK4980460.1 hypothetical protein LTR42_000767 [Elasticomyces elasticus]